MFGISIFQSPEHFVALALSIFQKPEPALQQLSILLHRTKNPPISIIYTAEFMKQKSCEEHGLDIVRFISQLSDLSEGYSVSSSLRDIINQSSFLTEVRHNLTHKTMVSPSIIKISKDVILKELEQKYWKVSLLKFCSTFDLSQKQLNDHYVRIFEEQIPQQSLEFVMRCRNNITEQWLIRDSSPYEFKESILAFLYPMFKQQNFKDRICHLFLQLSQHKKAIALSKLIRKFLRDNKNENFADTLVILLNKESKSLLKQPLILHQLKQMAFIKQIGFCSRVLQSLNQDTRDYLFKFWDQKLEKLKSKPTENNKFSKKQK